MPLLVFVLPPLLLLGAVAGSSGFLGTPDSCRYDRDLESSNDTLTQGCHYCASYSTSSGSRECLSTSDDTAEVYALDCDCEEYCDAPCSKIWFALAMLTTPTIVLPFILFWCGTCCCVQSCSGSGCLCVPAYIVLACCSGFFLCAYVCILIFVPVALVLAVVSLFVTGVGSIVAIVLGCCGCGGAAGWLSAKRGEGPTTIVHMIGEDLHDDDDFGQESWSSSNKY